MKRQIAKATRTVYVAVIMVALLTAIVAPIAFCVNHVLANLTKKPAINPEHRYEIRTGGQTIYCHSYSVGLIAWTLRDKAGNVIGTVQPGDEPVTARKRDEAQHKKETP